MMLEMRWIFFFITFCLTKREQAYFKHIPYTRGDIIPLSCSGLYTNGTPNPIEWQPLYCQDVLYLKFTFIIHIYIAKRVQ